MRWLAPLLVVLSGVLLALVSPHFSMPWVWLVALAPMFLALELVLRQHAGGARGFWVKVAACTVPVGILFGGLTGGWVTHTAHVFGGLPLPVAVLLTWLAFGGFHGLELFAYLGAPFALARRRPWLALALVPLWATVLQVHLPRFLSFTYGHAMFSVPALVQFADVLGSGGLNLLYLPLQLIVCYWGLHFLAPGGISRRGLTTATVALGVTFAAAFGYGQVQLARWETLQAEGKAVELVGIQPNFSLEHLATSPGQTYSRRQQGLAALIADSSAALSRAERRPGVPVLTLWPESVYPRPFFLDQAMRATVEEWVERSGTELMLASLDFQAERPAGGRSPETGTAGERPKADRPKYSTYGVTIHLDASGRTVGVYRKIALIPYGETIPLAGWIPFYRDWVRALVPMISEFTPGGEFTVFTLSNGVKVAPMICFDATNIDVARGMARNGARLGVVLANLAWFGPTTVSEQFGFFVRFRAIENRMPILMLSQNGRSTLFDATGREVTAPLEQFTPAALVRTVGVPEQGSFFTAHGGWVHHFYGFALLAVLAVGWRLGLDWGRSTRKR